MLSFGLGSFPKTNGMQSILGDGLIAIGGALGLQFIATAKVKRAIMTNTRTLKSRNQREVIIPNDNAYIAKKFGINMDKLGGQT